MKSHTGCYIAIIVVFIILIIIIFSLYWKKSRSIENMKNINSLDELVDRPWTNSRTGDRYRKVNTAKAKRQKKLYDQEERYISGDGFRKSRDPIPLDDRPDLSQCQPCICPEVDKEKDEEDRLIRKYLLKHIMGEKN